jgi:hypothetical protein
MHKERVGNTLYGSVLMLYNIMFANIICFIEAPLKRVLPKRKLQKHIDYDHN